MKFVYMLQYRDKEAVSWFNERAFTTMTAALAASIAGERADACLEYRVTLVPLED